MVSRGHHTQTDGQGFILSQLYVTSYGQDLQKLMDEGEIHFPTLRVALYNLRSSFGRHC